MWYMGDTKKSIKWSERIVSKEERWGVVVKRGNGKSLKRKVIKKINV